MDLRVERRLLQAAIALGCLVPLLAGGAGMIDGVGMIAGIDRAPNADLDSHMRYLSGLLFGIGVGFASCIPRVEAKGARFQLLGAVVLVGGLVRALSLIEIGPPEMPHRLALGMELGTMPLLMLWQWRVARAWRGRSPRA